MLVSVLRGVRHLDNAWTTDRVTAGNVQRDGDVSRTSDVLAKRQQQRILRTFASSNIVLAFDYDGTLAPIVATPALVRIRVRHGHLRGR